METLRLHPRPILESIVLHKLRDEPRGAQLISTSWKVQCDLFFPNLALNGTDSFGGDQMKVTREVVAHLTFDLKAKHTPSFCEWC